MSNPREGVRFVLYPVPDIEAAKQLWANLLGVAPFTEDNDFVRFQVGDTTLALAKSDEVLDGPLVYWLVPDVAEAMETAIAAGSTEHQPVLYVASGGSGVHIGRVRTPEGTIIGFREQDA